MSKHKDKDRERTRDDRRSRERERSRDRDHRKRSRDRSKEKERRSHKKSKDKDRSRSRSRKSSRRDRSRDRSRSRERSRRNRSREGRRSRSPHRRRTKSPVPKPVDVTPAQHALISQLISSSLAGNLTQAVNPPIQTSLLGQPPSLPIRTDFSNLFQSNSMEPMAVSTNTSAMAIAAAKARELLKAKNLNIIEKSADVSASNGNESNHDDEFRAMMNVLGDNSSGAGDASNLSDGNDRKRKKKSRWASTNDGTEGKTFIPGMPTILPSNLNADQQEAYLVQLQIEEISRKLRTGDLGVSLNPEERSPSPEPIYSSDGKRLNTREFRTRKKLEDQRHMLITRMQCMNPEFKPPSDYKPPVTRVSDKVLIPQEEHPDINFVGLLIGPRGNTLKAMEKETGAKIIIRGKGSVKEGKVGRKDGQPLPGEDEPLHAFITASTLESVKKAVDKIKEVIRQGIEVPEGSNDLRRMQLRELALLNGTLRETDGMRCSNCGSSEHKSWLCPDKPNVTNNIVCSACGGAGHISKDCKSKRPGLGGVEGSNNQAKIDEEYMSLMAELGEVQPQDMQVKEIQPPPSKPYNIFDNPRHQSAPRQLCPPVPSAPVPSNNFNPLPPMSGPPPPWQMPNTASIAPHPMGSYPPMNPMNQWGPIPPIPQPPFSGPQMNQPPPPVVPPPPGTDLCPPGTSNNNSWSNPPLPPGNYWDTNTNFLPPPPPPE